MEIITVLTAFTLAIVSPGPNFLLVVNRAIGNSRQTGIFTALGVATGSGLFALAGMLGVMLMISALPHFSLASRFLGGSYLVWMGIGMLRGCLSRAKEFQLGDVVPPIELSPLRAYRNGLFTNLTNPKAWAFYLSLFILVVSPDISFWGKTVLTVAMFLISFCWYTTVAVLITNDLIRPFFMHGKAVVQGGTALLLIWLGGSLFFLN